MDPASFSRTEANPPDRHYQTITAAIAFIRAHAGAQPTLEEIAAAVHLSPFHLQRLFADWAGISPKRFLQYLTKEYAKRRLAAAADVLSVAADAGLSSTSRLHDLMVSCEAMTPGEIKSGGLGMEIGCGFAPSPFGETLVAWTARGLCHFAFCIADEADMLAELSARWPGATLIRDDARAGALLRQIFPATPTRGNIHLVLRGTNFQIKVWEALIRTEFGEVVSYRQLARQAGAPSAARWPPTASATSSPATG